MRIKKFNENINTLDEYQEVIKEALTFITDNFEYDKIESWYHESQSYFYTNINILFDKESSYKPFEDEVNNVQYPTENFEIFEERAKFWKEVSKMKNHLDSIFDKVIIIGNDYYDNSYNKLFTLTIKCKN